MFEFLKKPAPPPTEPTEPTAAPARGLFGRLRERLSTRASSLARDLGAWLPGRKIDAELLDELELRLLTADVGIPATERILDDLRRRVARRELADLDALLAALRHSITELLTPVARPREIGAARPVVTLVVGVNGSGKTTSIGKLAHRLKQRGLSVMLAAGDTFRAAAVEQLQVWGERNEVPVIAQAPGADPAQLTVPLHEPALLFAQLLRRALLRRGIQVAGTARALHYPERPAPLDTLRLTEVGHLESPPLLEILQDTLKNSINLNAELLLLQAGAAGPTPGWNTESRGLAALDTFLQAAGVKPGTVLLEEGSGLSRKDLVTPDALVGLLAYMSRTPGARAFRELLPLAGVDGTLKARMAGTRAEGRIQAKTGTLRYAYCLSGYASTASGERLAFSILLNNYHRAPQDPPPTAELDAIALTLAECTTPLLPPGKGLDN